MPADIEDMLTRAEVLHTCPYYATRQAVPDSELVVLPYNMLFHKPTRESLGIDLKGHIVICDEAHNVIETVASLNSPEVTLQQVRFHSNQTLTPDVASPISTQTIS